MPAAKLSRSRWPRNSRRSKPLRTPMILEAWRVMKSFTALAHEQVGVATPVVLADDAVFLLPAADLAMATQLTRSRCTVGFRARRSRARDGEALPPQSRFQA